MIGNGIKLHIKISLGYRGLLFSWLSVSIYQVVVASLCLQEVSWNTRCAVYTIMRIWTKTCPTFRRTPKRDTWRRNKKHWSVSLYDLRGDGEWVSRSIDFLHWDQGTNNTFSFYFLSKSVVTDASGDVLPNLSIFLLGWILHNVILHWQCSIVYIRADRSPPLLFVCQPNFSVGRSARGKRHVNLDLLLGRGGGLLLIVVLKRP